MSTNKRTSQRLQAAAIVKLRDGREGCASLSDFYREARPYGVVVWFQRAAYLPSDVQWIRVFPQCPVELLDAAVEAGYFVMGGAEGRPEDMRLTENGE